MREQWYDYAEIVWVKKAGAQKKKWQMTSAWTTQTDEYRKNQPQQVAFQECADRLAIFADEQKVPADADDGDNKR